ncbi:MAG: CbiQ family ECF transporter T component [Candidatus Dormibacteria bacterium]
MNPRAVAAWVAACLAIVLLVNNPVYRGLVALVAINLLVAHRRPGLSLRPLLLLLLGFTALTILYNPLLSHAGAHPLAHIPRELPGIGGAITVESIAYGASAAVGLVAAALVTTPLFMVLDPTDIVEVLPDRLRGTGTALAAALNLLPAVATSFQRVRESERLRGSPRRGPAALVGLVVPVTLSTLESSITLAEAMEARAYGSGPRTRYPGPRANRADVIAATTAIAGAAVMLALRLTGTDLDWYPFPVLTVPFVAWPALAACAFPAVALLAWA